MSQSLDRASFRTVPYTIPAGEKFKTLDQISRIYDTLIAGKIDRQSIVLALGGGVVGDMTGFAAATVLRGVPFVQVPTTLLSMVDASVGGKTGVDHPLGKNLIGAFHQPIAVLVDPRTLATLPERELRSGLAECIKHDIIRDADHFAQLATTIDCAALSTSTISPTSSPTTSPSRPASSKPTRSKKANVPTSTSATPSATPSKPSPTIPTPTANASPSA